MLAADSAASAVGFGFSTFLEFSLLGVLVTIPIQLVFVYYLTRPRIKKYFGLAMTTLVPAVASQPRAHGRLCS